MRPIEDIAREATGGHKVSTIRVADGEGYFTSISDPAAFLERFAALVRAEALEEAASLTQTLRPCGRGDCDDLASAIRALKDTHGITAPSAAEGGPNVRANRPSGAAQE